MRKEDVKIGMKVKAIINKNIDGVMDTKIAVGVVKEPDIEAMKGNDYFVVEFEDGQKSYIRCLAFEPYEEAKEDVELNVHTKKGYVINLDALDNFGTNLETGEKITPKEILDVFCERGVMLSRSEDAPITQEFIESFGFECSFNNSERITYLKKIYNGSKVNTLLELEIYLGVYYLTDVYEEDVLFTGYTCTTQSELRFLLTKGRIDCSK